MNNFCPSSFAKPEEEEDFFKNTEDITEEQHYEKSLDAQSNTNLVDDYMDTQKNIHDDVQVNLGTPNDENQGINFTPQVPPKTPSESEVGRNRATTWIHPAEDLRRQDLKDDFNDEIAAVIPRPDEKQAFNFQFSIEDQKESKQEEPHHKPKEPSQNPE